MEELIEQINVENIADKIDMGCLWDWCLRWRTEAKEELQRIENEYKQV